MNAPFAVLVRGLTSFTGFGFVVIWLAISWASLCRRQKSLPISRARPVLPLKTSTHLLNIPTCRCKFNHLIYFCLNDVYTGVAEFRGKMKQLCGTTFTGRPCSKAYTKDGEIVTHWERNIKKKNTDCVLVVSGGKNTARNMKQLAFFFQHRLRQIMNNSDFNKNIIIIKLEITKLHG